MELCNPSAKPRVRMSPVETESSSITLGRSTYKLTYSSKLSIACGRQHNSVLTKIARYIPGFSGSAGFILQKQNDVASDDYAALGKRPRMSAPNAMGAAAAAKSVTSQFIPLSLDMAAALFDDAYVESLKGYVEEEIHNGAGTDGGNYQERSADKPACRYPPPLGGSRHHKSTLGTLIVGAGVSNFNIVRSLFSDSDDQFEGDENGPQLLCQITMTDSKSDPSAAPMIRFSAPSSDMIKILESSSFRKLIDDRTNKKRPGTPRPEPRAGPASDSD